MAAKAVRWLLEERLPRLTAILGCLPDLPDAAAYLQMPKSAAPCDGIGFEFAAIARAATWLLTAQWHRYS